MKPLRARGWSIPAGQTGAVRRAAGRIRARLYNDTIVRAFGRSNRRGGVYNETMRRVKAAGGGAMKRLCAGAWSIPAGETGGAGQ